MDQALVLLLMLLPLLGFGLTGLVGRRLGTRAWIIAVPVIIVTWAIAMVVVYQALFAHVYPDGGIHFTLYQWIPAGTFQVDVNFAVDALTAVMLIVVCTIGMLVHVYSIGYMAHDASRWRFFAYLNFFMFSMLLLVLADNFLLLFVAWELVGLSSYLLIGFWYRRRSAALAAKKAFIVNRVGDLGFSLGIMAIWTTIGTLNFPEVFTRLPELYTSGGIQTWQMSGSSCCSSAARWARARSSRCTSGCRTPWRARRPSAPSSMRRRWSTRASTWWPGRARCSPTCPARWSIVAAVGIFTAHLRGVHRVHADGHQAGAGVLHAQPARLHVRGARCRRLVAAIFHLVTHGFFKGLLFLGSGSVIHGVHDEQDMNRMGGLARKMPITHWTMLIGRAGDRRDPAPRRLLLQGRDPRRELQERLPVGLGDRRRSSP